MSATAPRSALAVCALAVCALGGCVGGLKSNVPVQQTYLLDLPPATVAADGASPHENLLVLAPTAAPGLGTVIVFVNPVNEDRVSGNKRAIRALKA